MPQLALAFDLDGVILDSEASKLQAFASVFSDYPNQLERITAYNARHRGVPRADKFCHICRHILQLADRGTAVERFGQRYAAILATTLEHVDLMPGIRQFLEHTPLPKFVCSSAPLDEITRLLAMHRIEHHFTGISGYPASKLEALQKLKQAYATVIFFGDALADYHAAQAVRTAFIGVGSERFAGLDSPCIEQFGDIAQIHALIRQLAATE